MPAQHPCARAASLCLFGTLVLACAPQDGAPPGADSGASGGATDASISTDARSYPDASVAVGNVLIAPTPNVGHKSIGVYLAADGTPLGDWIRYEDYPELADGGFPVAALFGPNGNVYLVDMHRHAIHVFSPEKELINIITFELSNGEVPRCGDFYGNELWVGTNRGRIVRFDTGNNDQPLPDIVDLGGDTIMDILILDDGRFLLSNFYEEKVELYKKDGSKIRDVLTNVVFPEQLQRRADGTFMVAASVDDAVLFFDIMGAQTRPPLAANDPTYVDAPRAVAELDNGSFAVAVTLDDEICEDGGCKLQELSGDGALLNSLIAGPSVRRLERGFLPHSVD